MTTLTYYDLLEVSPKASSSVIASAYRALSQKYHPDKNGGDGAASEMMSKINVAYAVLSDTDQRKQYDLDLEILANAVTSSPSKSKQSEGHSSEIPVPPDPNENSGDDSKQPNTTPFMRGLVVLVALSIFYYVISEYLAETEHEEYLQAREREERTIEGTWFLAESYLAGDGFPQNYKHAIGLYEEISKKNMFHDGRAERRLGEIYFYGLGVPVDFHAAKHWYEQSLAKSTIRNPVPSFMVALMYEEGIGSQKDKILAYRFYNLSAGASGGTNLVNKIIDRKTMRSFGSDREVWDLAKKKRDQLAKTLTVDQIAQAQAN